ALDTVTAQVTAALAGVAEPTQVLLAYEPVWAIGEHGTPATPEQVGDVVTAIASVAGHARPVLYGGSVSLDNARGLLDLPEVAGLFVGRAAWDVEGFLALADLAGSGR